MTEAAKPEHSDWGGSVAYRVRQCPGSVALLKSVPRKTSAFADEGTWAHALAAYCLEQGYRSANDFRAAPLPASVDVPEQFRGKPCADVVDAVNVYLDAVFTELDLSEDAELLVEQDFMLPIEPRGWVFGRSDAVVWHPGRRRLRTFDYKNGSGVVVDIEDNDQAFFYAAGVLAKNPTWKPVEVINTIVQPNPYAVRSGALDAVRDQSVPPVDLALWLDEYQEAVAATIPYVVACSKPKADPVAICEPGLRAGPWCSKTFCDAAAVCPARERMALQEAQLGFEDLATADLSTLVQPKDLDLDRLEAIVANAQALAAYASVCEQYLESLAMSGAPLKRFKLVEKIGRRKYVAADQDVIDYLELNYGMPPDVSTRTQLQTLTEMLKLLKQHGAKKDELDDFQLRFTAKESSGLTMAPISDKRPAAAPAATSFGDVNIMAAD